MRLLIHYLSGYHRALIVSAQKDFEKKGRKRKKKKQSAQVFFRNGRMESANSAVNQTVDEEFAT